MFNTPIPDAILATLNVNNRNVKCKIDDDDFTLMIVESGIPNLYQILQHNDSMWNYLTNKSVSFPFNPDEIEFNHYYISQDNRVFKPEDIENAKEVLAQEVFDDLSLRGKNIKIDWQQIFDTVKKIPEESYYNTTKTTPERILFEQFHRSELYFYKNFSKKQAVYQYIQDNFFNKNDYYMNSYNEVLEKICLLWLTKQISTHKAIEEIYNLRSGSELHDAHYTIPTKHPINEVITSAVNQYLAIYEFYQNHASNYQRYKDLYNLLDGLNAKVLNVKFVNDNNLYKMYREGFFKSLGGMVKDIRNTFIFFDVNYQFLKNIECIKYRNRIIYQK